MMRPARRRFTIALLTALPLFSAQLAHGAIATPDQKQVIDRFIASSSYASQFEQLPLLVREQLESGLTHELSAARYQELTTLLLDSFEADRARNAMTQQLSLGYDTRHYRALLQKLESPPLRKLRNMEQAIHQPVARYEMQHFIARLPENPAPAKREALIKELLAANGAIEDSIKTRAILHELVNGLMDNSAPQQQRSGLNDAMEESRRVAERQRPAVESEILAKALYTYRDASDAEIKQYIEFYNSAAGQWFKHTQQNSWLSALRNIGRDITWKMQHPDAAEVQTALEDELGF
jgi:hypothetical protein